MCHLYWNDNILSELRKLTCCNTSLHLWAPLKQQQSKSMRILENYYLLFEIRVDKSTTQLRNGYGRSYNSTNCYKLPIDPCVITYTSCYMMLWLQKWWYHEHQQECMQWCDRHQMTLKWREKKNPMSCFGDKRNFVSYTSKIFFDKFEKFSKSEQNESVSYWACTSNHMLIFG